MTEIVAKAPDTSVTTQNSSGAMWRVIQSMSLVAWAVGDTYGRRTHRQAGEHSRPANGLRTTENSVSLMRVTVTSAS